MTDLSKGANAALTADRVDIAVAGARQGAVDLMAFQLAADGKVRSDADFVFFNQPSSPEGAVRLVAADRLILQLGSVPPAVEILAVAVALDDTVTGSLAGIAGLGVTVSGGAAHTADVIGLTSERAAVLVEIYRRSGGWKVRNVSAGWAAGLPALAAAHGVSVDEAPAGPDVALPPAVLPVVAAAPSLPALSGQQSLSGYPAPAGYPPPTRVPVAAPAAFGPANAQNYPMPGGWPPPGGSLPPRPEIIPPRPGGWPPPGGSLPA